MSGKKKSNTVNDARIDMFLNKYKTKEDQRINAAKTLDGMLNVPMLSSYTRKNQTQRLYFKNLDVFILATPTCVITIGLWVPAGNKQLIHSLMVQRRKLSEEVRNCY